MKTKMENFRPTPKDVELNQKLNDIIKGVAESEGFKIDTLPEIYVAFYKPVDTQTGVRCVDGRNVLEKIGNKDTGYKKDNYTGVQIPAGTLGELDAVKLLAKLSESEGREIVKATYTTNRWRMGGHIDDDHKKIQNKKELDNYKEGCGNQRKKSENKLPMYSRMTLSKKTARDRIDWLRKNKSDVYPLTGNHEENISAVNLHEDLTFHTPEAVESKRSVFSCDLASIYSRAGEFYETLKKRGKKIPSKTEFQVEFTKTVFQDYLQTIVALGGNKTIYTFS